MKSMEKRFFLNAIANSNDTYGRSAALTCDFKQSVELFNTLHHIPKNELWGYIDKWEKEGFVDFIYTDKSRGYFYTKNFKHQYLALYLFHDTQGKYLQTQFSLYKKWLELHGYDPNTYDKTPSWFRVELRATFKHFSSPIKNPSGYRTIYFILPENYEKILLCIDDNYDYESKTKDDPWTDKCVTENNITMEVKEVFETRMREKNLL